MKEKLKSLIYLKSCSTHEIFLLQTQFFTLKEVVIGVEHSGDVLSQITVQYGLNVVTIID